jgi:hypothetical protein
LLIAITLSCSCGSPSGSVSGEGRGGDSGRGRPSADVGGARTTGRMVAAAEMSSPRAAHTAKLLKDGSVFVAGGCVLDGYEMSPEGATAELYGPETDEFAAVSTMDTKRFKLPDAVAALAGGGVLVGGDGRHAELYYPDSRSFRRVRGDPRSPRAFATTVPLAEGTALVTGGYDKNINLTNNTWLYAP